MMLTSWRLRKIMISGWNDAGFTSFLIPTKVNRVRSFQISRHFWCSLFTMIVKWWAWKSEGRNLKSSHTWLIWTITMLDGLGIHRESAREMTLLPASQDLWWPTTDLVIVRSSIRSFEFPMVLSAPVLTNRQSWEAGTSFILRGDNHLRWMPRS